LKEIEDFKSSLTAMSADEYDESEEDSEMISIESV
jgi:hypothetical protein